jgi:hypothetical protein
MQAVREIRLNKECFDHALLLAGPLPVPKSDNAEPPLASKCIRDAVKNLLLRRYSALRAARPNVPLLPNTLGRIDLNGLETLRIEAQALLSAGDRGRIEEVRIDQRRIGPRRVPTVN